MNPRVRRPRRPLNRRAFLRGTAGATLALPFLEGLPHRSAWGADENPVFALYICAVCGVVPEQFLAPVGPLTSSGLAAAGVATSELARHADNLLFLSGVNWPSQSTGDAHAVGLCEALTAVAPTSTSDRAMAGGPSADVVIASHVQPNDAPITLFAGDTRQYIGPRLSFAAADELRAPIENPHEFYLELMGLTAPGGGMAPGSEEAVQLLIESRNGIHDLVRDELSTLMGHSRLSTADRQRLQQHFDAIRDAENTIADLADEAVEHCSAAGLEVDRLQALESYQYDRTTTTEESLRLHMSLVAMAFACNHRRSATIQWGGGYDTTVYLVPSNPEGYTLSYIGHRTQSDSGSGPVIPNAEQAHAEIDVVRMQSLSAGLDHFEARGLADHSFVMWTNHFQDGPGHSFRNIPHIIWGNGGGYLKQGEHFDLGSVTNDVLHNTLISAAIQDTGTTVEDFGDGTGGLVDEILA